MSNVLFNVRLFLTIVLLFENSLTITAYRDPPKITFQNRLSRKRTVIDKDRP